MYFRYCGYFGWLIFAGALMDWMFAYYMQQSQTARDDLIPAAKPDQQPQQITKMD
jgi:hypothetical protein